MICKNCGAEYDENRNNCPYCGTENHVRSLETHRNVLNAYEKQTRVWQEKPKQAAKKSSYLVAFLIVGFIFLGIVIAGISFAVRRALVNREYRNSQDNIEQLEEIYQSGDYDQLYNTWYSLSDRYSSAYEKYYRISLLYRKVDWATDNMEPKISAALSDDKAAYLDGIEYLIEVLAECESFEEEGYVYEEDAGVRYFSDLAYGYLEEVYLLDEEEIKEYVSVYRAGDYGEKEAFFLEIQEKSLEHLKEDN